MEDLALIYGDEAVWESLQPDERAAAYAGYTAFAAEAREAGVLAGGDELTATASATTVRVRQSQARMAMAIRSFYPLLKPRKPSLQEIHTLREVEPCIASCRWVVAQHSEA